MRRAAVSVGANLAEGCGRRSSTELARFVRIALGSATELDHHLLLCRDLEFLSEDDYERVERELVRISKMLSGLLASIAEQIQSEAKAAGA
jgi:four helix bundle protein